MKKKYIFGGCIAISTILFYSLAFAESWQSTLELNFDIVETFDSMDDWRATNSPTCSWSIFTNNVPGDPYSRGINWGAYAWKSTIIEADREWTITNHGSAFQVGSKSLMVGVEGSKPAEKCYTPSNNYTGHQSVGAFKGYFGTPGDKTGNTGYSEVYIFMRYYLPSNSYPTAEEDLANEIFKYVDGQEYQMDRGVGCKKINIGLGFTGAHSYHDPISNAIVRAEGKIRYGDSENWLYMRPNSNSGARRTLGGSLENRATSGFLSTSFTDAWSDIADELGAVEIYMKLGSDKNVGNDSGNGDGIFKVWFYKADGTILNNGNPVVSQSACVFRDTLSHKINRLFFHSNHRTTSDSNSGDYYFKCGEGMDCVEWIDDVIIDDHRIGTRYFDLIDGLSLKPQPPNLEVEQ